ncbi:MAG: MBL fold metallo-hydrolase [Candidatus Bathycorpusculaceae bacterium]
MIREVFPNIFQIEVPLPHNPLGHLNSYLIKSGGKTLLIDTGLNFPQAFQSLCQSLSETGTDPQMLTGILLTHFHVDHVGLIPRFKEISREAKLWIHSVEAGLSKLMVGDFENYTRSMANFLKVNGAPTSIAMNLQRFHPAFFTPKAYEELAMTALQLDDGQEVSVGNYCFRVLWTPGHSPGHICLYEPNLKALISGDHVLPTITPHVSQFLEGTDPLEDYLGSLERVEKLDVEVVLPAHETTFTNLRERIGQLRGHHKQRLKEIVERLSSGRATPYMLASNVHWNIKYKSWDDFPPFHKYLALGEALSHLTFLEKRGVVRRVKANEKVFYEIDEAKNLGKLFFQ